MKEKKKEVVDTPRAGAWCFVVNTLGMPKLPKPVYLVIGKISAADYRIQYLNGI